MSNEPTTVEAITAEYLTPIARKLLCDPNADVTTFELIADPFEFPRFGEKQFYLIPFHYTSGGKEGQSHVILRVMPRMDAVMMLTGDTEHRELKAFQQGFFNDIPDSFHHPYVHVVLRPECYVDSEVAIGKAIGSRRKDYFLFTKCCHAPGGAGHAREVPR